MVDVTDRFDTSSQRSYHIDPTEPVRGSEKADARREACLNVT